MAEAFLSLAARERADILRTAAARSGRAAIILEKDIWVCWVLQALFSMPDPHPMAFKGGTSLSKVYGIIDRFSEDVDVTLEYRAFNDGFDPFAAGASRNQIRLFSERLRGRVTTYISDVVAPALGAAADGLAADGQHDIRIGDDGETIRFAYPSAVEDARGYVRSEVLLEFGGRNVIDPNEQHTIHADMADLILWSRLSRRDRNGPLPGTHFLGEGHAGSCRVPQAPARESSRTALPALVST